MKKPPKSAPEIYQKPLTAYTSPTLPPVGTPEHEQAVIMQVSLEYASKGWSATVTSQDGMLRVIAVPQDGIEPKAYILGLLRNRFIEDALQPLEAIANMLDGTDPDIDFNLGVAYSELDRVQESLAPLHRCLENAPDYTDAHTALGVSYAKLNRNDEAAEALQKAAKQKPDNALIKQNLAGVLARSGKFEEALPVFRQAASLAPDNPAALMGLAQCLDSIDGHETEARKTYEQVAKKFPGTQFGEAAKQILNRQSTKDLRKVVGGAHRPDVLEYMISAMRQFAAMPREQVGQITLQIARLGEQGLSIHDPSKRYTLENLEGDFSGLQLLSYMHVGLKMFDPRIAPGTGLDQEYEIAASVAASDK